MVTVKNIISDEECLVDSEDVIYLDNHINIAVIKNCKTRVDVGFWATVENLYIINSHIYLVTELTSRITRIYTHNSKIDHGFLFLDRQLCVTKIRNKKLFNKEIFYYYDKYRYR